MHVQNHTPACRKSSSPFWLSYIFLPVFCYKSLRTTVCPSTLAPAFFPALYQPCVVNKHPLLFNLSHSSRPLIRFPSFYHLCYINLMSGSIDIHGVPPINTRYTNESFVWLIKIGDALLLELRHSHLRYSHRSTTCVCGKLSPHSI